MYPAMINHENYRYDEDEIFYCKCGEEAESGTICNSCLREEANDKFTMELGKEFLEDCDLEKEFYVEYYFESDFHRVSTELIELCKREFDDEDDILCEGVILLKDFCMEHDDFLSWYREKRGEN